MALLEQAKDLAGKDTSVSEYERIVLLLLISVISRQDELLDNVVQLQDTPFVVAGEFIRKHPKLFAIMVIGAIGFVVFLTTLDFKLILDALML